MSRRARTVREAENRLAALESVDDTAERPFGRLVASYDPATDEYRDHEGNTVTRRAPDEPLVVVPTDAVIARLLEADEAPDP